MLQKLYFGQGKLLLSSEYFVLDGAKALALPTKLGQQLSVQVERQDDASMLIWKSFDNKSTLWFKAQFSQKNFHIVHATDIEIAKRLQKILRAVDDIELTIPSNNITTVTTELDFPIDWGLGSSSTLIYTVAKWTNSDPFDLLTKTLGGSGYDIACAGSERPIFYQKIDSKPQWETVDFDPIFKKQLYFVHLNKKQNSRESVLYYKEQVKVNDELIDTFSDFTDALFDTEKLEDFEKILVAHEELVATTLKLDTAKNLYFEDYWGTIKSLGAWGGDFVLATSNRPQKETIQYFKNKGFNTIFPYKKLIC